jgi:hypothetical protein
MLAFPTFFPAVQRAGNRRSPVDRAARAGLAVGPQVARQRHTMPRDTCPVSIVLSDVQLAAFESWWFFTLAMGCAWFTLTLNGELEQTIHAARFSGGYQVDGAAGTRWKVAAHIEIDNPPHLSADDYAGMILNGAIPLGPDRSALHVLVHTTLRARLRP